ncbi:ribonuclease HII [Gorillibacterium massiliense]|uniref:ribonuclease HII n=1 Tax=Gorillibacterium massiliense TaxID=1280390 RepID=UPI0004BB2FCC|nr:ribonuclease HII [Gorillibacterium massiliense]
MLEYERSLWDKGVSRIAGIDEVGRGCLFGDVVAAAVILPQGMVLEGVNDSKKLSPVMRERLFDQILTEAVAVSYACVGVEEIERINIKMASRLAMKIALSRLHVQPDYLLVDAEKVDSPIKQLALIHGDALSQSIAAASIVAKVVRDRMCLEWDKQFPQYGIAGHKGYATKLHREMLQAYGPTPLHRMSFLGKVLAVQEEFILDL